MEHTILIVEDEKGIRDAITIYLKNQGYHVYEAENGAQGLEMVENHTIHLAIVDIMMPVMDGITMTMKLREKYEAAMEDDFNTADAVSAIFELVKLANSTADASSTKSYVSCLLKGIEQLCDVLGIITERKTEVLDSEIEEMIAARQQARKDRNFALADEIRGKLLDMGIVLEDTREGVKWKRA